MFWWLTACLFRFALPLFEIVLVLSSTAETLLIMQTQDDRQISPWHPGRQRQMICSSPSV